MKVRVDFPLKHVGLSDIGLYGENDADSISTIGHGKSEWSRNTYNKIYDFIKNYDPDCNVSKVISMPLEILYRDHGKESFDISLFEELLEFELLKFSIKRDSDKVLNRKQIKIILDIKAKYGDSMSLSAWGKSRLMMNATAFDYLERKSTHQYKMEDVITRTKHLYCVTFDNF